MAENPGSQSGISPGMFVIEPCQTIWGHETEDRSVMACTLRTVKGTEILGFEANHLLVKHKVESFPTGDLVVARMKAFKIGRSIPDNYWSDDQMRFLGFVRIGEYLHAYAVFLEEEEPLTKFAEYLSGEMDKLATSKPPA